jgi:hypothetical protein
VAETEEEYNDLAPGLIRHHDTECPAYNSKGRDVASEPCVCGARPLTPRDSTIAAEAELRGRLATIERLEQIAANMRWNDDRNMLVGACKLLRAELQSTEGQG